MRTSNMTEGGPKSSTQKRKKKRTYCRSSCAGSRLPAPSPSPLLFILTEVLLAALLLLLPCPLSIHATSKLWQLPCVCAAYLRPLMSLPLCPVCVAYFLAPHCCRCCRTKGRLSKLPALHAQRCVSTAYQTYPSIHPPVHLPMTRQLRTSERPTAVHCMSMSMGYPFSPSQRTGVASLCQ